MNHPVNAYIHALVKNMYFEVLKASGASKIIQYRKQFSIYVFRKKIQPSFTYSINKIFPKKSYNVLSGVIYSVDKYSTLQRHKTENWKQIFPEKELRSLSPNFHIHVSVNDLHIPMLGLPILLQEDMWTDPGNTVYKSLTDT